MCLLHVLCICVFLSITRRFIYEFAKIWCLYFGFPGRPRLNADCWLSRQLCRLLLSRQTLTTIHYSLTHYIIAYHTYVLYSMNTIHIFTIAFSIQYMYNCTCCLCCRGKQAVAVTRASQPSQPASGISMSESKQTKGVIKKEKSK